MSMLVMYILGAAMIVAGLSMLWYLFQTLRIIWRYSALVAIAAVLFSPLVHIVFYLLPKEEFDSQEKFLFNRYFLSIGAIVIIGIVAAIAIPATTQTQLDQNDDYQSAELEAHLSRIYEAHPDADDIVDSDKFKNWWQSKPDVERRDYERVLHEGNSSEVIHMLTLFEIETGGI
ncbi:hypothetical protein [Psychrobacter sp. AOP7-B1-24]|uniref:hypothetical protein n=1 Tax=Psychrobacter sp. AOP7-B1-24 TaxID=3457645 RepID=UPI00402B8FBC